MKKSLNLRKALFKRAFFLTKNTGKTLAKTTKKHQNEKSKTPLRASETRFGVGNGGALLSDILHIEKSRLYEKS